MYLDPHEMDDVQLRGSIREIEEWMYNRPIGADPGPVEAISEYYDSLLVEKSRREST